MTWRIPPGVRAIYFDAVGTLIHPEPSAGEVYHQVGQRHGSRLGRDEVRQRFARAFAREEAEDARHGWRTDELHERTRWRAIVATVLDDVASLDACFAELYDHFARPSAWRCAPLACQVITTLIEAGYQVGIASNFDARLRHVVAGLDLPEVELVISSEVGWRKPAAGFFARLARGAAQQTLLVGDDPDNDLAGARQAGMHALLLDPHGAESYHVRSLAELIGKS